ncbi:MAG TPA: DJ-1/PfpI family protein [Kofleriaceae bacterium]|nr:DJ-1/PfpI family protein [Kofleriaceae bacterium]
MDIAIVAYDDFTDLDVFLPWDLLNRVRRPDWRVRILGEKAELRSVAGLRIPTHAPLEEANAADAVLFTSGPAARRLYRDPAFLSRFHLDPSRQRIGSMCSGSLILAALGLLRGKRATTYPTSRDLLAAFDLEVVEESFVQQGNVATAAGCLSGAELSGWIIAELASPALAGDVLRSVQPVGRGLSFSDGARMSALFYSNTGEPRRPTVG